MVGRSLAHCGYVGGCATFLRLHVTGSAWREAHGNPARPQFRRALRACVKGAAPFANMTPHEAAKPLSLKNLANPLGPLSGDLPNAAYRTYRAIRKSLYLRKCRGYSNAKKPGTKTLGRIFRKSLTSIPERAIRTDANRADPPAEVYLL